MRGTVTWIGKPNGLLSKQSLIVLGVNLPFALVALVVLLRSRHRRQQLPDAVRL
jgi:hypothetical protein